MAIPTDLDLDLEARRRVLDSWVAKRREIAALEAAASELLMQQIAIHDADVAASPHHRDAIYRSMIAEFSAAARIPRGSIEFAFTEAQTMQTTLPCVHEALAAGRVSIGHVREIVRAADVVGEAVRNKKVDPEVMKLYEAAVLVFAEHETAALTGAHAKQVAAALVGETVVERHRRAEGERCVTVRSVGDGLSLLTAVLPEWAAAAIVDRLAQMTRQVVQSRDHREPVLDPRTADESGDSLFIDDFALDDPAFDPYTATIAGDGTFAVDPEVEHVGADERTWDQVQADLFADMLLTADPSAAQGEGLDRIQARVQVTVAATTLIGADDRPAELDGHGPIDPEVARRIAGRSTGWSRLFLDASGMVTSTDTYTPTEAMRRFLRARDQHCRFPGCRMPVHRCDIDHNHDHARGGRTSIDNLSHFCRSHHVLKHPDVPDAHRWTAQQRQDGTITWFSPLGRAYPDRASRRVMFV
ncbi:DUF222 domain-containing protein [Microbacterium sp. 179-I 3D2 NHS]|uniref:HNH endonuclease signature motif containing protein n=1 Tax=Microbacterium sp. 179-I 3D2 NHS TaxID=3235178 RepID=UPI0039A02983